MGEMTDSKVREWLERAFYATEEAKALELFAKRCKEQALRMAINYESVNAGKCDSSKNGTYIAYTKLAEAEEKAREQAKECACLVLEIQNAIFSLNDKELESMLINRYLNFMTVRETAEFMNCDERTVMRKIDKAIKKLSPNVIECHSSK